MRFQLIAGSVLLAGFAAVQDVPKEELRKKLKDTAVHASWIYDDLPAAFEQAKASNKPILALFRCVP
jgi:hypothetical protein